MQTATPRIRFVLVFAIVILASLQVSAQSNASRKALETAASKGNLAAIYALGAMAEAEGDFERALTLYSEAAEKGYAGAEFKLGELHRLGHGVPSDAAKAVEWYRKAAAHGSTQAEDQLQQLQPETADSAPPSTDSPLAPAQVSTEPQATSSPSSTVPATESAPAQAMPAAQDSVAAPSQPTESVPNSNSGNVGTVLAAIPFILALVFGILGGVISRPLVMRWYRSRQFFISGRSGMEMMAKEVKLRLEMEWIPVVIAFGFGYVGYFFGFIVVAMLGR